MPSENVPERDTERIAMQGGWTQREQIEEVDTVVQVVQEHFGSDVAEVNGEPWDAERFDSKVKPRSCDKSEHYRYSVEFAIPEDSGPQELYAQAEEVTEELGLEPNENNGDGSGENSEMFYGAGSSQGRTFIITTEGSAPRGSYDTRCSDDNSIREVVAQFDEDFVQEFESEHAPPSELPG